MFGLTKYEKRLKAVEERQDGFSRQMAALQLEWDETYDKIRTLFARIAKRQERAAKDGVQESSTEQPTQEEIPGIAGLTGRAAQVQQQILARRRRINGGG